MKTRILFALSVLILGLLVAVFFRQYLGSVRQPSDLSVNEKPNDRTLEFEFVLDREKLARHGIEIEEFQKALDESLKNSKLTDLSAAGKLTIRIRLHNYKVEEFATVQRRPVQKR